MSLLGIAGSLRKQSNSLAVLNAMFAEMPEDVSTNRFDLHEIPLYDADLNTPASVSALKNAIERSSGLVVVSSEYNWGIPGVLKNAIDWASRPGYASVLKGKPVLVVTQTAGALGGARAHQQIRETFASTLSRVTPCLPVLISAVANKVKDGKFVDDATRAICRDAISELLLEVRLLANRL
jgi:chromate reductase